ncbi:hypothetical protein P8C59_004912 [Phyllachora maydis]|uniref:Uncharacterized protein n=1 Tax=Phyllachora maydis TaxID=1825666 RepID=A0AAD9I4J8_9PEZI|nr:hypothetical protein P8C59_004912 [Phyllachora maydis]
MQQRGNGDNEEKSYNTSTLGQIRLGPTSISTSVNTHHVNSLTMVAVLPLALLLLNLAAGVLAQTTAQTGHSPPPVVQLRGSGYFGYEEAVDGAAVDGEPVDGEEGEGTDSDGASELRYLENLGGSHSQQFIPTARAHYQQSSSR